MQPTYQLITNNQTVQRLRLLFVAYDCILNKTAIKIAENMTFIPYTQGPGWKLLFKTKNMIIDATRKAHYFHGTPGIMICWFASSLSFEIPGPTLHRWLNTSSFDSVFSSTSLPFNMVPFFSSTAEARFVSPPSFESLALTFGALDVACCSSLSSFVPSWLPVSVLARHLCIVGTLCQFRGHFVSWALASPCYNSLAPIHVFVSAC